MSETRSLYRPVGLGEMDLILRADCRAFPPRLPEQPIFYPVLHAKYAESIIRNWNVNDPFAGYAGFVTAFEMPKDFLARYDEKSVGSDVARELWVPAAELAEFNAKIIDRIRMIKAYYGESFKGLAPATPELKGKDLQQQFLAFEEKLRKGADAFAEFLAKERCLVYLHYPYWSQASFETPHLPAATREKVLDAFAHQWRKLYPDLALLEI